MTVVIVLCCYLAGLRQTLVPLGAMVVVSTFALGIHWLGDVLSGIAAGLISVVVAYRWFPVEKRQQGAANQAPA